MPLKDMRVKMVRVERERKREKGEERRQKILKGYIILNLSYSNYIEPFYIEVLSTKHKQE